MLKPIKYRCATTPWWTWWRLDGYMRFHPQSKEAMECMLMDMLYRLFACAFTIPEWIDYKEAHKLPPLLECK